MYNDIMTSNFFLFLLLQCHFERVGDERQRRGGRRVRSPRRRLLLPHLCAHEQEAALGGGGGARQRRAGYAALAGAVRASLAAKHGRLSSGESRPLRVRVDARAHGRHELLAPLLARVSAGRGARRDCTSRALMPHSNDNNNNNSDDTIGAERTGRARPERVRSHRQERRRVVEARARAALRARALVCARERARGDRLRGISRHRRPRREPLRQTCRLSHRESHCHSRSTLRCYYICFFVSISEE